MVPLLLFFPSCLVPRPQPSSRLPLVFSSLSLARGFPPLYTCRPLPVPVWTPQVLFSLSAALRSLSAWLWAAPLSPPLLSSPHPHSHLPRRLRLFSLPSTPAPHPGRPTWGVSDDRWATPPRGPGRRGTRGRGGGIPAASKPRRRWRIRGSCTRGRARADPGMRTPAAYPVLGQRRGLRAPGRHPVQEIRALPSVCLAKRAALPSGGAVAKWRPHSPNGHKMLERTLSESKRGLSPSSS